jgi:hypothetical protein
MKLLARENLASELSGGDKAFWAEGYKRGGAPSINRVPGNKTF